MVYSHMFAFQVGEKDEVSIEDVSKAIVKAVDFQGTFKVGWWEIHLSQRRLISVLPRSSTRLARMVSSRRRPVMRN